MDLHKKSNGTWELRWREAGRRRSRSFDRKKDAEDFESDRRRRKQLGHAAIPADVQFRKFAKAYWRLHAIPNLAPSTREFYALALSNHIVPRLGDYGVRELTPKRLARFREELERAGVGTATVRKVMAIIQSILSFAVAEELVDFNAAAAVRKPQYERARDPHIFLPGEVEEIRSRLASLRNRTLISVLAYSGARPEEVVCRLSWDDIGKRTIRFRATKKGARSGSRPCSPPSRRTSANGLWQAAARRHERPCSRRTTAASGISGTGRTGGGSCGRASPSGSTSGEPPRRRSVARQRGRDRGTYAQASSRFSSTPECR